MVDESDCGEECGNDELRPCRDSRAKRGSPPILSINW